MRGASEGVDLGRGALQEVAQFAGVGLEGVAVRVDCDLDLHWAYLLPWARGGARRGLVANGEFEGLQFELARQSVPEVAGVMGSFGGDKMAVAHTD